MAAQVSTGDYREGWDRIFSPKPEWVLASARGKRAMHVVRVDAHAPGKGIFAVCGQFVSPEDRADGKEPDRICQKCLRHAEELGLDVGYEFRLRSARDRVRRAKEELANAKGELEWLEMLGS